MNMIENIELGQLVSEVSASVLEEKKKSAAGFIKALFYKIEELDKEIKEIDKQKSKKTKSLEETLEKINKLKSGDWSVLQETKNENTILATK